MKKEDFKFDFKALERMEDNGVYFGDLNERDYHSLASVSYTHLRAHET